MNEENNLVKTLLALAEYYRETLSAKQLAMYAEDLSTLTPEELESAVYEYRLDPQNKFFPLPAVLISIARPRESDEDSGRLAAARIVAAISKFGWNNPEYAKSFIGPVGWEAVQLQGGWKTLCESVTYENKSTVQAQLRNLSESLARSGNFVENKTRTLIGNFGFDSEVKKIIQNAFKSEPKGDV